jgi:hypothetical protein
MLEPYGGSLQECIVDDIRRLWISFCFTRSGDGSNEVS